ncbi:MAG: GIY-YIG nuclease family protein [Patescibacteria group bacterium]|nr:GIY-YIG nuclease family protein [Patescibacteria group bacterium]MDE2588925.1 GIY-YIG nuclease family protein [Patescibacteria group bacterium]
MRYFVYIVHCADDSFYVGITTDVSRRIEQHNGVKKGGAKYTRAKRPVRLCFSKVFASRPQALRQEHVLKQLTHQQKQELCNSLTVD